MLFLNVSLETDNDRPSGIAPRPKGDRFLERSGSEAGTRCELARAFEIARVDVGWRCEAEGLLRKKDFKR